MGIIDPEAALESLSRRAGPRPKPASPPRGIHDPRLDDLLRWAAPSERVAALATLEPDPDAPFVTNIDRARYVLQDVHGARPHHVCCYRHGNAVAFEASPQYIRALRGHEQVRYVCAQDIAPSWGVGLS